MPFCLPEVLPWLQAMIFPGIECAHSLPFLLLSLYLSVSSWSCHSSFSFSFWSSYSSCLFFCYFCCIFPQPAGFQHWWRSVSLFWNWVMHGPCEFQCSKKHYPCPCAGSCLFCDFAPLWYLDDWDFLHPWRSALSGMDNEFANMWISMQKKHLPCPCTSLLWFCFTLSPCDWSFLYPGRNALPGMDNVQAYEFQCRNSIILVHVLIPFSSVICNHDVFLASALSEMDNVKTCEFLCQKSTILFHVLICSSNMLRFMFQTFIFDLWPLIFAI